MWGSFSPQLSRRRTRPRYEAEPLRTAELIRAVERELHPEADTEVRRAGVHELDERRIQTRRAQVLHRPRVRSDAREHEPVGAAQLALPA